MKVLKLLLYTILIVSLNNCGSSSFGSGAEGGTGNEGNADNENVTQYDIYFCSYVSVGLNNSRAGIYGIKKDDPSHYYKIIDLDDKSVDSCTVDSVGNIYWGDRDQKKIFKANRNGGNIKAIVSGLDIPYRGLTINETNKKLYWTNWLGNSTPQSGEIGSSDLNGSNRQTLITNLSSGGFISIDEKNEKIYISDLFGDSIVRTDLSGKNMENITSQTQPNGTTIDILKNKFLWHDRDTGKIYKADFNDIAGAESLNNARNFDRVSLMAFDKKRNGLYFVAFDNTFDENLYYYNFNNAENSLIVKLPGEVVGLVMAK